jgi:hypothetical protein
LTRKSWVKTASILHKEQNKLHLRYQEKVKATGYPVPVDFGPEIWLEFKQRGLMQRIFMGYEGRIDLNSATRLQIQNFIYSSSYHENSWFSINFLKTHIAPSFPGTRAAERDGILNQAMEIRDSAPRGHLRSLGELRDLPGNWFSKVFIESYRPELK